jgi:glycosyltransferase involved in cell wall biosynthesis
VTRPPETRPAGASGTEGRETVAEPRICVIVPAFNEGASVAEVVRSIRAALPTAQVVVVDDGSKDDTAERAAAVGAHVLALPLNLGIGGAVQTGYLYAQRNDFDLAMQIDGDGQHDPREARFLIDPIVQHRADLVVGSRWLGRGDYKAPSGRRFGMKILSGLIKWRTGQRITDTTSGFRAVGRPGIDLFARSYSSDFPEVEALVAAKQCGLTIEEVPVHMEQRLHGRSSIAGLRSSYYMVRVVVALVVDALNRKEQP